MNFKFLILCFILFTAIFSCNKTNTNTITNPSGVSGSLAKMIIVDEYLYVIDNQYLTTFDISDESNPIEKSSKDVGFGIETLFPFANYLFIGSIDGLYIYDISDPVNPVPAANNKVDHFTSCDPVVANNNYAYVTLNTLLSTCGNSVVINEMQIVDVQDVFNPFVVKRIPMKGPKGLGLDGASLFVCDENLGVIIFDLSDPIFPIITDTLSGFVGKDIIAENGNLMVVCNDGLRQFNYSNIDSVFLISHMSLND